MSVSAVTRVSQSPHHEGGCAIIENERRVCPLCQSPQWKVADLSRPVPLIAVQHLGRLKHDGRADEKKHIAWEQAMPDTADKLSDNKSEEAGGFAFGGQPLVHICR